MTQSFCRTAVPDVVWSDGGPQFISTLFNDFSKQWGFVHKTSSPHYPQSNGKIEAIVKCMKKIITTSWGSRSLKADTMCRALLQYRNTPSHKDGQSPAQKLYSRPIQDTLPAYHCSFVPEWQHSALEAEQLAAHTLAQSESFYNTHVQHLTDIQLGSTVALQNPWTNLWDIYGMVVNISPYRRYSVKTQSGRILVCNRHCTPASLCASVGHPPQLDTSQHPRETPPTQANTQELPPCPTGPQTPNYADQTAPADHHSD